MAQLKQKQTNQKPNDSIIHNSVDSIITTSHDENHISILYIEDVINKTINWFFEDKSGQDDLSKELFCLLSSFNDRDEFISIISVGEKKNYRRSLYSLKNELMSEYSVDILNKSFSVKEFAVKNNSKGVENIKGIMTFSLKDTPKKSKGKYLVSSKSILSGSFDSNLLNELEKTHANGLKKKLTYFLLMLSLDNIPMIDAWHSEEVTDSILDLMSKEIKTILPKGASLFKASREQYCLILQNFTLKDCENLAYQINRMINLYKSPLLDDVFHLRASMGSVSYPLGTADAFDIINKAYLALTHVKTKDNIFFSDFEEAKRDHIDSQNEMVQLHHLQEAYNQDRLKLAYQPIISATTGKTEYYECLLRINDGNNHYSSAGRFIPIAEKMGTIDVIDEFVLKSVIEELKENRSLRLCVNVSNITTCNDKWLKQAKQLLQDDPQVASRVSFEITETAAQQNLRKAAYFTATIQSLGCKVALDDFGVGYTSFRQIRSLSIDVVKIDGSFVLGLEESSENSAFVKSLVDFSKIYGLKTVAECVENGEVAKKLIELGVDYLQGYYFGYPSIEKPWLRTS